jgi:hypothetical protein
MYGWADLVISTDVHQNNSSHDSMSSLRPPIGHAVEADAEGNECGTILDSLSLINNWFPSLKDVDLIQTNEEIIERF